MEKMEMYEIMGNGREWCFELDKWIGKLWRRVNVVRVNKVKDKRNNSKGIYGINLLFVYMCRQDNVVDDGVYFWCMIIVRE